MRSILSPHECEDKGDLAISSGGESVLLGYPGRVERALAVDAFVGVGAEEVALGLDEVGRKAGAAVAVVPGERG